MITGKSSLGPERVREVLDQYYSPLPCGIETKVQRYMEVLGRWAQKISLTSLKDPGEILRVQFGESIFALSLGKLPAGRLADIGTGAGFPGLAIKLAIPGLSAVLIEPNKKKCAFLHEVVRSLELEDVAIIQKPFETTGIPENSMSTITCRALGVSPKLLNWARETLDEDGALLLWLGEEGRLNVKDARGWTWEKEELIPETRGRYILRGRPLKA